MQYIEIAGAIAAVRLELTDRELHNIGEFTRENIANWLESHITPEWIGILPVMDFHAVCGDIDIPWASEEGFDLYQDSIAFEPLSFLQRPKAIRLRLN